MLRYQKNSKQHFKLFLTILFAIQSIFPASSVADNPFKYFSKKRPKSCAEQLAEVVEKLEEKIHRQGTVVAKVPDIWGEARLTRYRHQFEMQMAEEVDKFQPSFQASQAISDQAFLGFVTMLSAASGRTTNDANLRQVPSFDLTSDPTNLQLTTNYQGVDGKPGSASTTLNLSTPTIYSSEPGNLRGRFGQPGFESGQNLTLERTLYLDQKKRYLEHLAEIRRINEGDDTADSPGYSLNLVRIPVSVLPGLKTRKGYGAEISITCEPHVTSELLPSTFRSLVINDLLDELSLAIAVAIEKITPEDSKVLSDFSPEKILEFGSSIFNPLDETEQSYIESFNKTGAFNQSDAKINDRKRAVLKKISKEMVERILRYGISYGNSAVSRRSRMPVPSSQLFQVFGKLELVYLGLKAYQASQGDHPSSVHVQDIRAYLKDELEASYDFLTAVQKASHQPDMNSTDLSIQPGGHLSAPSTPFDPWTEFCSGEAATNLRRPYTAHKWRQKFFCRLHNMTNKDATIGPPGVVVGSGSGFNCPSHLCPAGDCNLCKSETRPDDNCIAHSVTELLAWAVLVESALLNQQLNEDIQRVSQDPQCNCYGGVPHEFYGPNPSPDARAVFQEYVKCRWPIHVFALDPVAQDQNVADSFNMRRESQMALAMAFASGQLNAQQMLRFIRSIQMDISTIALNRTAVGFGHGADTFGWRFFPRVQTPSIESNATVLFRDLIWGGPTRDDLLADRMLEPGMRECTAVVLMPSFISHCRFDIRSNYFKLNRCSDLLKISPIGPELEDGAEWHETINQTLAFARQCAMQCPTDQESTMVAVMKRLRQLLRMAPLQTIYARVPNENNFGGFEMFSSGITDLAPELLDWFGAPGIDPSASTTLYLYGSNFSVHETRLIAGNKSVPVELLSREIMQVTIPPGVRAFKEEEDSDDYVVDVHLATPYGITRHLHIPVNTPGKSDFSSNSPSTEPLWMTQNFAAKYLYQVGTDDPETSVFEMPFDISDLEIRKVTEDIKLIRPAMPAFGSETAKLSLSLSDPNTGAILNLGGDGFQLTKSKDGKYYHLKSGELFSLLKAIKGDTTKGIIQYFHNGGMKKHPPKNYQFELTGKLVLTVGEAGTTNMGKTELPLPGTIKVILDFEEK